MRQLDGPRPYRSAEADPQLWSSREEVRDVAEEQRNIWCEPINPIIKWPHTVLYIIFVCVCHQCHIERFITLVFHSISSETAYAEVHWTSLKSNLTQNGCVFVLCEGCSSYLHCRLLDQCTLLGHTRSKINTCGMENVSLDPFTFSRLHGHISEVARFQRNVFMSVLSLSSKSNPHMCSWNSHHWEDMIALKCEIVWMCRMIASCCKDVLCQNTLWKATSWGTVFGYPEITRQPTENEIKLRSLTPRSTAYKGWPGSADFVALCPH